MNSPITELCNNYGITCHLVNLSQVFKTEKRGWGIRTLADIPQGAFICIYVGNLYTNKEANIVGQNYGDEYFAELDMIETVEKCKDGYESDYEDPEIVPVASGSSSSSDSDSGGEETTKEDREMMMPGVLPEGGSSDRQMRARRKAAEAVPRLTDGNR